MDYWRQQSESEPLFPDVLWSKPETKATAGKLGIIGGSALSFLAVANSHQMAIKTGMGEARLVLPQNLKKQLGSLPGVNFAPINQSGGLSKEAKADLVALQTETDGLLMIGDVGKNNETQLLYENFMRETVLKSNKPVVINRDAVDLLMGIMNEIVICDNVLLVLSFSQLQKVFQAIYYPIVLVHSIQTVKLVEALHKFTVSNQASVAVFHNDMFLVASRGNVATTPFNHPTEIWQGRTATKMACWFVWNKLRPLEAAITALSAK